MYVTMFYIILKELIDSKGTCTQCDSPISVAFGLHVFVFFSVIVMVVIGKG